MLLHTYTLEKLMNADQMCQTQGPKIFFPAFHRSNLILSSKKFTSFCNFRGS